jgi:hypothetical protein
MSYDSSQATIGVPMNSGARDYAYKIHSLKGKSWNKRGLGTRAKGSQADEKFITRAVEDETKNIILIFESEINKALEAL